MHWHPKRIYFPIFTLASDVFSGTVTSKTHTLPEIVSQRHLQKLSLADHSPVQLLQKNRLHQSLEFVAFHCYNCAFLFL